MKVLADQQIPFAKEAFQQFGDVELIHGRDITQDKLTDTDILLIRSITKVNESLLKDTPVKFIGTATSGFDHIDQSYLQNQGIAYTYAPGSNARSVAEYILSALFVLTEMQGETLEGKSVGVIGYGHVGSKVTRFFQALGLECLINDPPLAELSDSDMFVSLEEALTADIVTLHVPLTYTGEHATKYLIGANELEQMKEEAILINAARGGVLNEQALLDCMDRKNIKVIIDTWEHEPGINLELLNKAQIATPHIAGYSSDGKLRATDMLYQVACSYFSETADWKMEEAFPDSSETVVVLEDVSDTLETINGLVLSAYDVRSDAVGLLGLYEQEQPGKAEYFDGLRKDYPTRYEFNHLRLKANGISKKLNSALESLGFHCESET